MRKTIAVLLLYKNRIFAQSAAGLNFIRTVTRESRWSKLQGKQGTEPRQESTWHKETNMCSRAHTKHDKTRAHLKQTLISHALINNPDC